MRRFEHLFVLVYKLIVRSARLVTKSFARDCSVCTARDPEYLLVTAYRNQETTRDPECFARDCIPVSRNLS